MRARTQPAGLAEAQSLFDLMDGPKPGMHGVDGPKPGVHGVDGHRARLRTRLLTAGPDALADHEMLEMALFLALPRRDTKPIARLLLNRFGSFEATISASPAELMGVEGVGEAGAAALKLVQGASLRLLRHTVRDKPILKDWNKLLDYLTAAMAHERVEQARVLFLDAKNRLLADEIQSRGTVNATMVYPREIVRRALELNAIGIVLVHNHPSGDPAASREDMAMTKDVQRAAAALGIALVDHIIIAGTRWLSFQRQGWL
jgi:DNA repair protein RadC